MEEKKNQIHQDKIRPTDGSLQIQKLFYLKRSKNGRKIYTFYLLFSSLVNFIAYMEKHNYLQ